MGNVPPLRVFSERWQALAKEQKISAGILAVCGIIALVLSVERLNASIRDPFTVSRDSITSAVKELNKLDPTASEEAKAKRRDTDGDGLSDYDELHRFQTSPYLLDTDGDGDPDNAELALGENPNCAKGQACAAGLIDVSGIDGSAPFITGTIPNAGDSLYAAFQRGMNDGKAQVVADTGTTSTDFQPSLVRDPAEIRRVLLESGKIDPKVLEQVSDAQLLELYDKAVISASQQNYEDATGKPVPDEGTISDSSEDN